MSRARDVALGFDAITIEGGLLPADWLARVAQLGAKHQSPADYGVPKGLNLRDELGRYWRIAAAHWQDFAAARASAADLRAPTQRLVANLMREVFGAADFESADHPTVVVEHTYPVSAFACGGKLPVVIGIPNVPLDQRDRAFGDAGRQRSAFGLLQDYLNAEDAALWGIACNGTTLRLARDNNSLTRPAWIEADLERIFGEERFADFTLLWLLIHASRFGRAGQQPEQCPLEAWREASREEGTRAREQLRDGVAQALLELGQGFLSHSSNNALRGKLVRGELTAQDYFRQLLRLAYRLIFLLTIEERGLLHPRDADEHAIKLYAEGYSLKRLVERARRRRAYDRHADLWQGLKPVLSGLATGQPLLALPALGGLFAAEQCSDLDNAELPNRALLGAMAALSWLRMDGTLVRTNWRDMKYEEFGSVYESLLELVPDITDEAHGFRFAGGDETHGNERKKTGSYYTPDDLVQQLLDSALEPVIEQRLAGAADPEAALLSTTVCDPACGSAHFLLAAAFRLADRLARLRAGGTPGGEEYRHALRDVVNHCLYGVDMNPMALELARTVLWLEAMTPDKPLGFLDHHLQCGDALLGVLDLSILDRGIPDDAYEKLTGDDKDIASQLKRLNKAERASWRNALATGDLFRAEHLAAAGDALEKLADDDLAAVAAKREAWRKAGDAAHDSRLARLADLYVGAFLLPKTQENADAMPSSRHLWAIANNQTADGLMEAETVARKVCAEARVFHWWLAFPQVAAAGGFSVMLGNPPWEVSQLDEEEFFAARDTEIASAAGAVRKRAIAELERENPRLWNEYLVECQRVAARNAFYRGGRYPLTAFGKLNTYALFAETFAQLANSLGRVGVIVPTGIATDDGNSTYFASISQSGRLISLLDFENREGVFPEVDSRQKFCLMTLGSAEAAHFVCFATQVAQLADARRAFALTPDDFALINPNTRTCPVFRSQRDAELTKAIYRRAPVLIREAVEDADGEVVEPEANPWGIRFSQGLFNMTSASALFIDPPSPLLPLYEAKMVHQFDNRFATFVATPGVKRDDWPTRDCTTAEHEDATFQPAPRYYVNEREVLARIARVPNDLRKAWLGVHQAKPANLAEARARLWLALAQWTAGELFRHEAGEASTTRYEDRQRLSAVPLVEQRIAVEYPACAAALHAARITGRKPLTEFPKWALRNAATPLDDDELATLRRFASQSSSEARDSGLLAELDAWMDRRSPRWLMGWRDICRSTDERTVIASVMPRMGVGHTLPLFASPESSQRQAALLGNFNSLAFDYVARQKIGGTHLTYGYLKQFPILPPDRYTAADQDFIVPRVLELTYTAHELADWARDLGHAGAPFAWDPDRRAQLRAELDAYYARLYGLSRDELRYILDPAEVEGADYPSETFRVLKNNETSAFGEYRTQRLVLEAWDAQETQSVGMPSRIATQAAAPAPALRRTTPHSSYASARVPSCEAEDWLAGLACDVLLQFGPISEAALRLVLTSPVPASADASELSAWAAPERLSRLPAIIAWFRDLSVVPHSGDLQILDDANLGPILGNARTRALAALLIDAYKAHEAELARAATAETSSADDSDLGVKLGTAGGRRE